MGYSFDKIFIGYSKEGWIVFLGICVKSGIINKMGILIEEWIRD